MTGIGTGAAGGVRVDLPSARGGKDHDGSAPARPRPAASAALAFCAALAWYATPDLARTRATRAGLRSGLLVALRFAWAGIAPIEEASPVRAQRHGRTAEEPSRNDVEAPEPDATGADHESETPLPTGPRLSLALAALAGSVASSIAIDRALFLRGERRRAAGVRCAHLRQALPLALIAGLLEFASAAGAPASSIEYPAAGVRRTARPPTPLPLPPGKADG